jgi:hypothetical protein
VTRAFLLSVITASPTAMVAGSASASDAAAGNVYSSPRTGMTAQRVRKPLHGHHPVANDYFNNTSYESDGR